MSDSAPQETTVDLLRREIVAAELQILELEDRLLAKETDRSDTVALLGQADLLLEQKIGYIMTLDQALNARIRELEQECDRKTEEIDRRGEAIEAAQQADEHHRAERDAIIKDLSERLEAANQEINRAHGLAGDYAEKYNRTETALGELRHDLAARSEELQSLRQSLRTREEELATTRQSLGEKSAELEQVHQQLHRTALQLTKEQKRVAAIHHSTLWRWSRPWRALFGPKA